MKKLMLAGILFAGLLFLTGCGSSDTTDNSGPDEGEENPTLMQALKNPKTENLAGNEGVYIIFVQSRDGTTMVDSVEALDTLYLLSAVGTKQTHVYETDKSINVINDRLVDSLWMETKIYHPADLPDIDFESAYQSVKAVSGDKTIAGISILYPLKTGDLIVGFNLQGDTAGSCEDYFYTVESGEVQLMGETKCFFDINDG